MYLRELLWNADEVSWCGVNASQLPTKNALVLEINKQYKTEKLRSSSLIESSSTNTPLDKLRPTPFLALHMLKST